jgi:hypothetical protein
MMRRYLTFIFIDWPPSSFWVHPTAAIYSEGKDKFFVSGETRYAHIVGMS